MRGSAAALLAMLAAGCGVLAQTKPAVPAPPSADAIMARVAANQDLAVAERAHYVYVQRAKTVSRRGGTLMCEETTDYRVTPEADGSHEELLKVEGRVRNKKQYTKYTALLPDSDSRAKSGDSDKTSSANSQPASTPAQSSQPAQSEKDAGPDAPAQASEKDDGIALAVGGDNAPLDRQLVENIRHGLMNDKSRDGIEAKLFPLTTKDQADYVFRFAGRERMNGRDVFHVVFLPKDRKDFGWKGDAYIDTEAYQPVLINTGMSRKVPFAVRTFLGTNFPGLGFTVTYAPQPDGTWFPVTFSTEFKMEVLFFLRRTIILDAQNLDFEKTHVTSRIVDETTPVEPDPH